MKVIFFGSSAFSVPFLDAVFKSSHELTGVVTGTVKIRGRGNLPAPDPVSEYSLSKGLNIYEMDKFDDSFYKWLKKINFDYAVSISFGKIIPVKFLEIAGERTINIHPSMLPKYRGPSPVISTLLNGDSRTGISLIKIAPEVDSGEIYMQTSYPVSTEDYKETLENKIINIGTRMLLALLDILDSGYAATFPQDCSGISYTRLFVKNDMRIDWNKDASDILNKIRGFGFSPGSFTTYNGKIIKILHASKVRVIKNSAQKYSAGQVISANREGLTIKCSGNSPKNIRTEEDNPAFECISVKKLKPQDRGIMDYTEFINGYRITSGNFFV